MSRPYPLPWQSPAVITPASRCAMGNAIRETGAGAAASGVSPWSSTANLLLAFPFVLDIATPIYKMFNIGGSAASGNFEVGILDDAFNKIVSSGSVANTNASAPNIVDTTDVVLPPGLYYGAASCDVTTTNRWFRWSASTSAFWQAAGCWQQASAGPGSFPNPATPADFSTVGFPLFGFITRTVFDV